MLIRAQGILYLSNLEDPTSGFSPVAQDSWAAADFQTGGNVNGYIVNAVDLFMGSDIGNPSGLTISVYDELNRNGDLGNYLGSLGGPSPTSEGIYQFVPTSTIQLNPYTDYLLVVTSSTPSSTGTYSWERADSTTYSTAIWPDGYGSDVSANGSTWTPGGLPFEFAVYATAVPEPSVVGMILLGAGVFVCHKRMKRGRSRNGEAF